MTRPTVRVVPTIMLFAALAACAGTGAPSHGAPPTGQPIPASTIDQLPVPIEQIPNVGDSINREYPPAIEHQPQTYPSGPNSPCGPLSSAPDDLAFFGPDTIAFRSVRYSGFSNTLVDQAIAIYPETIAAQTAFAKWVAAANACKSSGQSVPSFTTVSPTALAWQRPVGGGDAGPTVHADQARLVQNIVVRVTVAQYVQSPQIAASVADQIAAKVNNPT